MFKLRRRVLFGIQELDDMFELQCRKLFRFCRIGCMCELRCRLYPIGDSCNKLCSLPGRHVFVSRFGFMLELRRGILFTCFNDERVHGLCGGQLPSNLRRLIVRGL